MKIICIGQNYLKHIRELQAKVPQEPVFFCKPDTALLIRNRPFFIPDFTKEPHYETELVLRICKGFDNSAAIGQFILKEKFPQGVQRLHFEMKKNGQTVQKGDTSDMIFPIDRLISHVSKFLTLRTGDYLFTGTPPGVGPIAVGDQLEAFLEGESVLRCAIK